MFDNYDDAAAATITRAQAKAEIVKHEVDGGWAEFVAEVGDRDTYQGSEVLDWLGY